MAVARDDAPSASPKEVLHDAISCLGEMIIELRGLRPNASPALQGGFILTLDDLYRVSRQLRTFEELM